MSLEVELFKNRNNMNSSFTSAGACSFIDSQYAGDDVSICSNQSTSTLTKATTKLDTHDCNWLYRVRNSIEYSSNNSNDNGTLITWMREGLVSQKYTYAEKYSLENYLLDLKSRGLTPAVKTKPVRLTHTKSMETGWAANAAQRYRSRFQKLKMNEDKIHVVSPVALQTSISLDNISSSTAGRPLCHILELARQQEENLKAHMAERERSLSGSRHSSVSERAAALLFQQQSMRNRTCSRGRQTGLITGAETEENRGTRETHIKNVERTTIGTTTTDAPFQRDGTFRKGTLVYPQRAPFIAKFLSVYPQLPSTGLPRPQRRFPYTYGQY